jgi:hypothetical protein
VLLLLSTLSWSKAGDVTLPPPSLASFSWLVLLLALSSLFLLDPSFSPTTASALLLLALSQAPGTAASSVGSLLLAVASDASRLGQPTCRVCHDRRTC